MKVGIITVHSVPNYGSVLQAYALATYLRQDGIDAETINYCPKYFGDVYGMRWRFPPPVNNWLRHRRSASFVKRRLVLSPSRYRSMEEFIPDVERYDVFITGSDQVWFTGPVQFFDGMYFLDFFAPGRRKISYAASAGSTTHFGEFEPRVRAALAGFDSIGVRDVHTQQLIAPLARRAPEEVIDPVFLDDFDALHDPRRRPLTEPYLLVFGDFRGRFDSSLRAIIAATGLRHVVSLQYPSAAATRRVAAPAPAQWLTWFRHAAFVVTSYFHGTAIAAKFSRPFISIPTPGRRTKVSTMLEWMGLSARGVLSEPTPADVARLANAPIDWLVPQAEIAARVKTSKAFLARALR